MIQIVVHRTDSGGFQASATTDDGFLIKAGFAGSNPTEAVGALLSSHPELFGVVMIEVFPQAPNRTTDDEGGNEFTN